MIELPLIPDFQLFSTKLQTLGYQETSIRHAPFCLSILYYFFSLWVLQPHGLESKNLPLDLFQWFHEKVQ